MTDPSLSQSSELKPKHCVWCGDSTNAGLCTRPDGIHEYNEPVYQLLATATRQARMDEHNAATEAYFGKSTSKNGIIELSSHDVHVYNNNRINELTQSNSQELEGDV